jgi:hypothetical protein
MQVANYELVCVPIDNWNNDISNLEADKVTQ